MKTEKRILLGQGYLLLGPYKMFHLTDRARYIPSSAWRVDGKTKGQEVKLYAEMVTPRGKKKP